MSRAVESAPMTRPERILERTAPPPQQPPLPVVAALPAFDINGFVATVEQGLNALVGGLIADEIFVGIVPDGVAAEEGQTRGIEPGVTAGDIDLGDDIGDRRQDGLVTAVEDSQGFLVPAAFGDVAAKGQDHLGIAYSFYRRIDLDRRDLSLRVHIVDLEIPDIPIPEALSNRCRCS